MRSTHSLFKIGPFTNHKLNWAALASFALVMLVAFVPPVRMAFELVVLPTGLYLWALALILFPIVAMEAAKALDFIKHSTETTPRLCPGAFPTRPAIKSQEGINPK